MSFLTSLALAALLPTFVLSQTTYSGGSWTMNASLPTDTNSPDCIILAQITPASDTAPAVIWGMQPICPTDPGPLDTVLWPITNNTDSLGTGSSLAIYAQVEHKQVCAPLLSVWENVELLIPRIGPNGCVYGTSGVCDVGQPCRDPISPPFELYFDNRKGS
jgi:hypothetical protein